MKHKKNLIIILVTSFSLCLLGAYLDTDPPYTNPTFLNSPAFEIFMMTLIVSVIISTIYFIVKGIQKKM